MDDQRMGEGQREPDSAPVTPPDSPDARPAPSESSSPTDEPTMRIPVTSAPQASAVDEAETARTPALDPAQWPTLRPASPPPVDKSRDQSAFAWARKRWRWLAVGAALLVVVVAAVSVYSYTASLAAQPQRIVSSYCAALTHADYKAAYALLAPSLQAQSSLAQYEADSAARDAISGRVTGCSTTPTQRITVLSFLNDPRSLVYNLTLTRTSAAHGKIALSRDATGWHVAALSASVAGIDLGPLRTEQALCQAFAGRQYDVAYGLLSPPYQHEQGSEAGFAKAFGANLRITDCAPTLKSYTLDSADQRASLLVTLDVTLTNGGALTRLTLPTKMTLVREPDGWRVDAITPLLSQ